MLELLITMFLGFIIALYFINNRKKDYGGNEYEHIKDKLIQAKLNETSKKKYKTNVKKIKDIFKEE